MFALFDVEKALSKLINKLGIWFDSIIVNTPNFVLAVIVFLFFLAVSRLIRRLVYRLANNVFSNISINRLIAAFVYFICVSFGVFIALSVLGLDRAVTSLLAGAGIIGLAISLAFQNTASNFISGIIVTLRKAFILDDWIETNGVFGRVDHITINYTRIITEDGKVVTIPNKEILEQPLINHTRNGIREVEINVGISYEDDLDMVMEVVSKAVDRITEKVDDRPKELYYKSFDDFSINLEITFWINYTEQKDYEMALSNGIREIKRSLNAANINIPYPIRKVELYNKN